MESCPICGKEFAVESPAQQRQYERHVNRCLDGEPDGDDADRNNGFSVPTAEEQAAAVARQQQGEEAEGETESSSYFHAVQRNVEALTAMLPSCPPNLIEECLLRCRNNVEIAVDALLQTFQGGSSRASPQEEQKEEADPHPPVRPSASTSSSYQAKPQRRPPPSPKGSSVELIVYDLQPDMKATKRIGLGVYHSGVIVYDHEFSFGGSHNLKADTGKSGIWASRNLRRVTPHVKKSITIGRTLWTASEVQQQVNLWGKTEWRVDDYHLLSKNCNHFAEMFLKFLGERAELYPPLSSDGDGAGGNPTATTTSSSSAAAYLDHGGQAKEQQAMISDPVKIKEAFQLPSWVNRAAKLGNAVIPDFVYKKILEAAMPPVQEDDPLSTTAAATSAAAPRAPTQGTSSSGTATSNGALLELKPGEMEAAIRQVAEVVGWLSPSDPTSSSSSSSSSLKEMLGEGRYRQLRHLLIRYEMQVDAVVNDLYQ